MAAASRVGRVVGGGQGAGVLADQVMEPVPAGGGLGDQVLVVEGLQAAARPGQAGVVQRGGGVGVDVGAGVQAQPAEQPPLGVGPGPGRTGRTRPRPTGSRPPSAPAGRGPRPGRRPGPRGSRPGGGPAAGRSSRSPAAGTRTARRSRPPQDRRRSTSARPARRASSSAASPGARVSRLTTAASSSAASRRRLVISTRLPGGARQQRPDLLMPGRVIQHQQDLLARQRGRATVPPARRCPAGSGPRAPRRSAASWPAHRPGPTGRCPGVWACSGKKNCPSGKRPGEPVRGVHREGGLADPGHPADRVNRHHPAATGRLSPPRHQLAELGLAAGEGGDVSRQRPAGRRRRPRPASPAAAASASPAGARPRAAATNSSRAGPSRPSAPASSTRGVLAGGGVDAALQVTDRPLAHLRGLGQLILGQPGLVPQLP